MLKESVTIEHSRSLKFFISDGASQNGVAIPPSALKSSEKVRIIADNNMSHIGLLRLRVGLIIKGWDLYLKPIDDLYYVSKPILLRLRMNVWKDL